jgi:hypothetical protein
VPNCIISWPFHFCIPYSNMKGGGSQHPLILLFLGWFAFFLDIVIYALWYFMMALLCIFLKVNFVDHSFIYFMPSIDVVLWLVCSDPCNIFSGNFLLDNSKSNNYLCILLWVPSPHISIVHISSQVLTFLFIILATSFT